MEVLVIIVLVAVVALAVASPVLRGRAEEQAGGESAERAELEAARDAKYREIRDTELDYRTGKLSEADWRQQDRLLRREAMELLRRLDTLDGREGETV